jgi:cobalamin biosynthesis Mg chelatase CobN
VEAEHSQGIGSGQTPGTASPAGGNQPSGQAPGEQATAAATSAHLANVERGRIAMIGGIVTVIWLAVLVLMVWNG